MLLLVALVSLGWPLWQRSQAPHRAMAQLAKAVKPGDLVLVAHDDIEAPPHVLAMPWRPNEWYEEAALFPRVITLHDTDLSTIQGMELQEETRYDTWRVQAWRPTSSLGSMGDADASTWLWSHEHRGARRPCLSLPDRISCPGLGQNLTARSSGASATLARIPHGKIIVKMPAPKGATVARVLWNTPHKVSVTQRLSGKKKSLDTSQKSLDVSLGTSSALTLEFAPGELGWTVQWLGPRRALETGVWAQRVSLSRQALQQGRVTAAWRHAICGLQKNQSCQVVNPLDGPQ